MSRYKPGDVVIVREDLNCFAHYYMIDRRIILTANNEMLKYKGSAVTIECITKGGSYMIEGSHCLWADTMFECLAPKKFKECNLELLAKLYGQ